MKLPILKYYFPSPLSVKLCIYFTSSEPYLLEKVTLAQGKRSHVVECLLYAQTDACNPKLLHPIHLTLQWIIAYLARKTSTVLPPMLWNAPSFTQKALEHLTCVPFGKSLSYQELASAIGHPKAARAVGNALNKNPFPFFLPCHRIISKTGKIGGFAYPLSLKQALLTFENSTSL